MLLQNMTSMSARDIPLACPSNVVADALSHRGPLVLAVNLLGSAPQCVLSDERHELIARVLTSMTGCRGVEQTHT